MINFAVNSTTFGSKESITAVIWSNVHALMTTQTDKLRTEPVEDIQVNRRDILGNQKCNKA